MSRTHSIEGSAAKLPEDEELKTTDASFLGCCDFEDISASACDVMPISILIVDDEPKNLTVLETILDDPAYRLVRAESAEQALLALLAEEFALLILDVRMPGVSGFELARMVKERRKTAAVPIIFLTAYYQEDQHMIDGYGSGAVDYLHKPIQPAVLRSKVGVFVDLYRKRRSLEGANRRLVAEIRLRRHAEEQLRDLNSTLERRVCEQTKTLRSSMQRLQAINDGSLEHMILLEPDGSLLEANRGALEFGNVTTDEVVGRPLWDAVWFRSTPGAPNVIREGVSRAAAGEQLRFELLIANTKGESNTLDIAFRPILNDSGDVDLIIFAALDISARKAAELSLRSSERRLREILDNLPAAVYGVSTDGRLVHWNPACSELAGITPVLGVTQWCVCSRLFHADGTPMRLDESPLPMAFRASQSMQNIEMIVERPDGSRRWVAAYPTIMRDAGGDISGGVNILVDITARKQNEERINLLMNEVDHRCKNILSVVQAIARQTALGGFEEFVPRFSERILALAASHDLLVESRWRGAELSALVRAHLLHFDAAFKPRVTLSGKALLLSNAAAQTVGMIVHELVTNAIKYGALSDDAGRVQISWDVDNDGEFSMDWVERGGPPAASPTRRGFGSTVITAMAEASFAGNVDLSFAREGLHWRLICPVTKIREASVMA